MCISAHCLLIKGTKMIRNHSENYICFSVFRSWLWWLRVSSVWQCHWCRLQFGRHCDCLLFSWFPPYWFCTEDMLDKWPMEWTQPTVPRSVLKVVCYKQMRNLSNRDKFRTKFWCNCYSSTNPHLNTSILNFLPAITCEPPVTPQHGTISPVKDSYYFGSSITFSCQVGFELEGKSKLRCRENTAGFFLGGGGDWDADTPTCRRKTHSDFFRTILR